MYTHLTQEERYHIYELQAMGKSIYKRLIERQKNGHIVDAFSNHEIEFVFSLNKIQVLFSSFKIDLHQIIKR